MRRLDAPPVSRWALFVLLLSHAALATALVALWLSRDAPPEPELYWDDGTRREVQWLVEQRYLEPLDEAASERLFHAALNGYVHRLDPFSRYFSPAERRQLEEDTSGSFGGIGVHIVSEGDGLLVTSVRVDGPADVAGVQPGETLFAADGETFAGKDQSDLIRLIKGEPGTPVRLGVRDAEGAARDVVVTRGIVPLDTVPSVRVFDGDPSVVYVRIAQFSESTPAEAAAGLRSGIERGARTAVLDLRGNLGGVVTAAVDVAGFFLPAGTLVCTTRGRDAEHRYVTQAGAFPEPLELPLAVLVDGDSASASELLAGALQDHGRATLLGTTTFGKFLVQTIIPLRQSGGAVRFTTSRYETPRGRSAQRDPDANVRGGLEPEVRVPFATRREEGDLALHFDRQLGPGWRGLPGRDPDPDWIDAQLQAALDLLRGAPLPSEPVPARVP